MLDTTRSCLRNISPSTHTVQYNVWSPFPNPILSYAVCLPFFFLSYREFPPPITSPTRITVIQSEIATIFPQTPHVGVAGYQKGKINLHQKIRRGSIFDMVNHNFERSLGKTALWASNGAFEPARRCGGCSMGLGTEKRGLCRCHAGGQAGVDSRLSKLSLRIG